jgi:hypothetical protein
MTQRLATSCLAGAALLVAGLLAAAPAAAQSRDDYDSDRSRSYSYGDRNDSRYGSADRDRYSRYGADRYGSDRYGSDRYGSDRYGYNRDSYDRGYRDGRSWSYNNPNLRQYDRGRSSMYDDDRYGSRGYSYQDRNDNWFGNLFGRNDSRYGGTSDDRDD